MNAHSIVRKPSALLAMFVAAVAVVLSSSSAMAEQPGPDQIRNQLRELEHKAKELKADGQMDKVDAVMREMQELRQKLEHIEKERRGDGDRAALERKLEQSRAELRELKEAGKADKAEVAAKRVRALEEELARAGGRPREGGREHGPQGERAEMEQKLQHLRVAIDHLHAAGIHDIADRLAQEVEKGERNMRDQPREMRDRPSPEADLDRVRAELQELRQAVRQLNARLEEQNRDRR